MTTATHFITSGLAGCALDTVTAGTTTDGAGAPIALGTRAEGNDGTEWIHVQAGAALSAYMFVAIDAAFQAYPINNARVIEGMMVGVVQMAFADNDFGWACLTGGGSVKGLVRGSCASGVPLYTDVSASGFLDDSATATQSLIEGLVTLTTQGSTTAQEGSGASLQLSWPRGR
jgi:hypothetical protein